MKTITPRSQAARRATRFSVRAAPAAINAVPVKYVQNRRPAIHSGISVMTKPTYM